MTTPEPLAITSGGQFMGPDGTARPEWAYRSDLDQDYFDNEWGRPVITEHGLLERITLEGFQSGLSWATILRKRPDFRRVFHMFDPERICAMTESDRQEALADTRLIRNERKHAALYANAQAALELREDPRWQTLPEDARARDILQGAAERLAPGLPVLVWSFVPQEHRRPKHVAEVPSQSAESKELAKTLKSYGFAFVGPTTAYALMQAIGMVNDRVDEAPGGGA
ncbi:DNA-3-methyladenine glycosylase I [Corynebacterium sp. zg254]|uniref:DNA-3-methyladenine glycosylase I n=1 Tax=Corynebacterium zhongnanshanii TaxID=2768834 RepID=A0ABQ6VBZ0_9CORY|nr:MULTISPECIES: DNA-3-methyladenine glycosylase I [Corynebacterium]KAB3519266.1 DNA-3-methyladenine glycosylase I [Corynebacterium zhongnanshanii]MCR5915122.1 DNA-3-methyladenine glycosylase I [Corynebacterium sp. zg254]